jgi:hypothetical protein
MVQGSVKSSSNFKSILAAKHNSKKSTSGVSKKKGGNRQYKYLFKSFSSLMIPWKPGPKKPIQPKSQIQMKNNKLTKKLLARTIEQTEKLLAPKAASTGKLTILKGLVGGKDSKSGNKKK